MTDEALICLRYLALVWARQSITSSDPPSHRYKNRLAVNFQPGMTPLFMKYLLETYSDKLDDIEEYSAFRELAKRIFIVDATSENQVLDQLKNDQRPAILIVQIPDLTLPNHPLRQFLRDHLATKHSVIVFSDPICGLHQSTIERIYNVKLRHIWLPRLQTATAGVNYSFSQEGVTNCYGIPAIIEMYDLAAWSTESIEDSVQDLLALWTRTEFKPFLGHFYTLFSVARSGSQLYANTRLSAELSMFDAATILGFVVTPAGIKRKSSADKTKQIEAKQIKDAGTPQKSVATKSLPAYLSGQPYSISAIPSLIAKFECDNPDFDAFKLLRGNTLKWFEAERAVARAIVESSKGRLTFGQKWSFFAHSKFVAQVTQKLSMHPQVIPKVKTKAPELDEAALKKWATGSRQSPPQSTMTSASWPTLIKHLDMRRVIIPVEMSKSPDVLFVLRNMALLCFQVKTGTQDNSLAQLVTELAKCPYMSRPDVTKNKVVFSENAPETTSVTFVYVAPVHAAIKAALMTEAVEFVKGNEKAATDAAVTKYFEYIHVKHGCKAINLPEKVEVIVLLRAGMEELFGEDYRTLLDPLCEVKSLEQEILREQLRAKTEPLATTIEEVEEEAMRVFERVRNVPGAEDILAKKLKELFAMSKQK